MRRIIWFILFFFASNALAIPGFDAAQAIRQYYVLVKQLKELKKQVVQADKMLTQGRQLIKDTEGHYGFGHLLDADSDFRRREWGSDNWKSAIKDLSGGNSARYQALLHQYQEESTALSNNQFSKGASQSLVKSYRKLVQNNRASKVSADYEYENIKSQLDYVHQLTQKIDSASNIKAAMDLNSRLISELSYISVEELRMQTLMNHQMTVQVSDEVDARTREAIFNQLPKES